MRNEVAELLKAERKYKRELAELRATRKRHAALVNPDKKMLEMIDAEIAALLKK